MSKKENIQIDDSNDTIRDKFEQSPSEALPVYSEGQLVGILEKTFLLINFKKIIDQFNKESKGNSELKIALLHNLYHEIRTPLNHVLGFMSVLSEMNQDDFEPNFTKYQQIIQDGSRQFLQFMNDLVELSLLESGEQIGLSPVAISPEELFIDLITQFESEKDTETKTTVRYTKPDTKGVIVTDYYRLKQVLSHLLNISIHHSSTDCSILMGCERFSDQKYVRFYIKNETAVINKVQSQIIRDSFQDKNGYDDSGKYGFGLDVVKKITSLIHGLFDIEIDDQGKISANVTIPYII